MVRKRGIGRGWTDELTLCSRDLYIRALSDMQRVNYRDTLSYFQISGASRRLLVLRGLD